MTAYIRRDTEMDIRAALRALPVVVVTGPRQSGKTMFLQKDAVFRDRRYVTLDDHESLMAARRDPAAFLSGTEPIIIDEAQKCPELFPAVKRAVDKDRRPGRFVVSGSADFALMSSVGESLAGRSVSFELPPFSRRERLRQIDSVPFITRFFDASESIPEASAPRVTDEEILLGGFPSVVTGEATRPDLWFRGYTETYVERDVRQHAQVADLTAFRTLLELLALRTGSLLNQSEVGRDAKLSASTVSRWSSVMETSYGVRRLPPYLWSKASRLVKTPKLYICDSGLAAWLTRVDEIAVGSAGRLRGPPVETFVAANLRAILAARRPDLGLSFWNVQGRHEVDFVVHGPKRAIGIEVKASARIDDKDTSGLEAFLASTPTAAAGVLAYLGDHAYALGKRLFAVPISQLLG